jgi:hypothetical protein
MKTGKDVCNSTGRMYGIPLAKYMQFHWQNVCNSTGKIYAIPLAECMQFHWQHVCDNIWMMPLDLKCFTQQWASPTASEQTTEDDSATV